VQPTRVHRRPPRPNSSTGLRDGYRSAGSTSKSG
jgi:hypothetical protein